MKFKVLAGNYQEGNVTYGVGAVVESQRDLVGMFGKESFQQLDDAGDPVGGVTATPPAPPVSTIPGARRPKPQEAPKRARDDDKPLPAKSGPTAPPPVKTAIKRTVSRPPHALTEGKDVTSRFPAAVEQDCKVFRNADGYSIFDADDLSEPLNKRAVRKEEVEAFVAAEMGV